MNTCSICHSKVRAQKITYTQWYENHLIAVENVPAEVCSNCGEEYFSPDVADKVQKAIKLKKSVKAMKIPVFELAS